ncbi:MAG: hypothetical protein R6V62_01565 [Candidatus Fermentibacteraceae bacterium]
MRRYVPCGILLLAAMLSSCTNEGVTSPALPEGLKGGNDPGYTQACQTNMVTIASQCVIYYAMYGTYPGDLYDLGTPYGSLTCPQCQSLYIYQGDQNTFSIACPLPSNPTHGWIVDGLASWRPGATVLCRSYMRSIASMCVIFFASEGRYPDSLEELPAPYSEMTCPECGLPIVLYSYDDPPECDNFMVICPKPTDPNHGKIWNGIASWPE